MIKNKLNNVLSENLSGVAGREADISFDNI